MNSISMHKFTLLFTLLIFINPLLAQDTKQEVFEKINEWYLKHPKKYSLYINQNNATAKITRYHPKRIEEKNNLIDISFKGMEITLAFTKPLNIIGTHKDSLQKYFNYVSLTRIYNTINSEQWDIYPQTPTSSLRAKGVQFHSSRDAISASINWSIYTVSGYKNSKDCIEDRNIMDKEIKESCYVAVPKKLELEILLQNIPLK